VLKGYVRKAGSARRTWATNREEKEERREW
jgi:hypothetical protein